VHTAHIITTYSWVILKVFLIILRIQYILLTLLLCTSEVFLKCSYLLCGESTYCSHYNVQLSYSKNILFYSEQTVNNAHITTKYGWVILKIFLVFLRRPYILLTTTTIHNCVFLNIFLFIPWRRYVQLTLLLRVGEFFWKCS